VVIAECFDRNARIFQPLSMVHCFLYLSLSAILNVASRKVLTTNWPQRGVAFQGKRHLVIAMLVATIRFQFWDQQSESSVIKIDIHQHGL
jgi:hypothetical protein